MKKCPRCKMTTNSHSECMVCKFDVTEVEYSERNSEQYVFNKYLYSYIFKNHMFLIACIALVISMLILALPAKDWYVYIACLLLLIDSFRDFADFGKEQDSADASTYFYFISLCYVTISGLF